MIKCKHCEVEKPDDEMMMRAGQPSQVCKDCKDKRAGIASIGGTKKKFKKRQERANPLTITVPGGGHGFQASITDDDGLLITQENAGAVADNVVLTRHEANQLVTMIGLWLKDAA